MYIVTRFPARTNNRCVWSHTHLWCDVATLAFSPVVPVYTRHVRALAPPSQRKIQSVRVYIKHTHAHTCVLSLRTRVCVSERMCATFGSRRCVCVVAFHPVMCSHTCLVSPASVLLRSRVCNTHTRTPKPARRLVLASNFAAIQRRIL